MTQSHRVVVSDKLSDVGLDVLRASEDVRLDNLAGIKMEDLPGAMTGAEALLVRSRTKVTPAIFEASDALRVVGRAGIGVDNIDLNAATDRGVIVMNAPSGNALTTAEHTIALIFALARNVAAADASMKAGRWDKKKYMGIEVEGKTIAVLGAGNIGHHVVRKCVALAMDVRVVDPFLSDEAAASLGVSLSGLDEAVAAADFITVHVPKTADTVGLIGDRLLGKVKNGVRILNVARGGIVDEDALVRALDSGKVAGAALDVYSAEPPVDRRLVEHPAVIATPHLGASTFEAQIKVAKAIAEQVRDFLRGGDPRNVVNPQVLERVT
jgi:D-3-phosphoglycerate dehydrogenase